MSKLLTEQKVLKKLDIVDFRHITKDKVITMASMLDRMEPEVAKKALEQFPQFALTVKDMLSEYKETLDKCLETNKENIKAYYDSCNSIIESLQKQLENNQLSFEERKYIIDKICEISNKMGEKDSEDKKFKVALALIGASAVTVATATLASVLGGNTKIDTNNINKLIK